MIHFFRQVSKNLRFCPFFGYIYAGISYPFDAKSGKIYCQGLTKPVPYGELLPLFGDYADGSGRDAA